MAEKSLFWNALPDAENPTGYDRNYNADDISDWLDVVLPTGVVKSETGLKVSAAGGMGVSVAVGKAVVNGKPYKNDSQKTFTIDTAPTGSTPRIDFIVLRFDRSPQVRNTQLFYKKGTGSTPPALVRTDLIYELAVAKITVAPAATSISGADITDLRGDRESVVTTTTGQSLGFCPYLTAAKGYDDYYDAIVLEYSDAVTMASAGSVVSFNIPQYGWTGVDIVNVYTNGMRERSNNYTINGSTITFKASKAAGTVVDVVVNKFIDGEGLGTALEQYKELQAKVLTIAAADKYKYICNGVNDNIVLSQIAQAFLSGTYDAATITTAAADFLAKWGGAAGVAALPVNNATIKIDVYGKFKASEPYAGTGAEATGYQWLALGLKDSANLKLIFDFSAADVLTFDCKNNAKNIIFYGADVHIIGAQVRASGNSAGSNVIVFSGRTGNITAENCKFVLSTTGSATIAESGTFINCTTWTSSTSASAGNFSPATNSRPVVVYGGTHYAYCANNSAQYSSVFYTAASATNAVIMAFGVNVPTVERSGFYQTNASRINAGKCFISGITTTLALTKDASSEISGHISISKA